MFKAGSRVLVQVLMLVAFIGQAMAYNTPLSCDDSVEAHSPSTQSDLLNHSDTKSINSNNFLDCCDIECCDVNCICLANAHSSFAYFNTQSASPNTDYLIKDCYITQIQQPISIPALLYRPPIFTS